jgi:CRP/FNR family transcriptional regulator, nitrogen oxide reductase regulator
MQRVAAVLVMLQGKMGAELAFTRQEIADMAGTTLETAIRILSQFKEQGIIDSSRGQIIVLDIQRLKLLSEGAPEV